MECFDIQEGTSLVRLFHATSAAPAVDVYLDNTLVAENLEFMQFTNYMSLPMGEHMVDVYETGTQEEPVMAVVLSVPDRGILTAAVTGTMEDLQLIVLEDDSERGITEDSSTVRAVHLVPDAPAVDITANNMPVANDLRFRQMTDYVVVAPGRYRINVLGHGSQDSVVMFDIVLEPNTFSTVYISGDMSELEPIHLLDGGTYLCRE